MPRKEFQELVQTCKDLIFKNGSYEQVLVVKHVGELVMDERELPEHIANAFCAALADNLAEVYESTLKWMSRDERGMVEDAIANAVWRQVCEDLRGVRRHE